MKNAGVVKFGRHAGLRNQWPSRSCRFDACLPHHIEEVMSLEWNNFKLSEKAKAYADKLIKEADEKRESYGGVMSKSNVKLDDDLNVIGVYNESS